MTSSNDGSHDASTTSTTNRTLGKKPSSPPHRTLRGKTNRTKLFPLKFEYNVSQSNVQIAQLHGQVIKALIAANGKDVTIYDKLGENEITMGTFPLTQPRWNESFYLTTVTNERNSKAIIMVGHQLASSLSLFRI
jgi:hypothetical protein